MCSILVEFSTFNKIFYKWQKITKKVSFWKQGSPHCEQEVLYKFYNAMLFSIYLHVFQTHLVLGLKILQYCRSWCKQTK